MKICSPSMIRTPLTIQILGAALSYMHSEITLYSLQQDPALFFSSHFNFPSFLGVSDGGFLLTTLLSMLGRVSQITNASIKFSILTLFTKRYHCRIRTFLWSLLLGHHGEAASNHYFFSVVELAEKMMDIYLWSSLHGNRTYKFFALEILIHAAP